jgi:hypothetical protein
MPRSIRTTIGNPLNQVDVAPPQFGVLVLHEVLISIRPSDEETNANT